MKWFLTMYGKDVRPEEYLLRLSKPPRELGKNVIYKWQRSEPSLKNLKAVADYFGCIVDDLIREENDR